MVRKLVSVDEALHLPTAVQDQLRADLDAEFSDYVSQAQTASGTATTAAATAETARDTAVAAAASATAPTDSTVASLIANPSSTQTAGDARYMRNADLAGYTNRFETRWNSADKFVQGAVGNSQLGNVGIGGYFRVVSGNVAGQHNDFPGLALAPNRTLVAVWRRGTTHIVEVGADLYTSFSTDYGNTWSTPTLILPDATYDQRDPSLQVLQDGRIALTYFKSPASPGTERISVIRFSTDNGQTWGPENIVSFGFNNQNVINGVMQQADGTIIAFGYGGDTGATYTSTRIVQSSDNGATWGAPITLATSGAQNFNEVCVDALSDGTLMALIRSDNGSGGGTNPGIYRTTSSDGTTWSTPAKVLDGWSRPEWLQLKTGAVVTGYRRNSDRKTDMFTSRDGGVTWSGPTVLHNDTTISQMVYFQMVEIAAGVVAVLYGDEQNAGGQGTVRFRYLADGAAVTPLGDRISGGWNPITPTGNWITYNSIADNLPAWRVRDGMVEVRSGLMAASASTTLTAAAATQVGSVPSALAPALNGTQRAVGMHQTGSGAAPAFDIFYVTTGGFINFIPAASGTIAANSTSSFISVPYLTWPLP